MAKPTSRPQMFRRLKDPAVRQAFDEFERLGGVPAGMIAMFETACPPGWELVSEMVNRFPKGAQDAAGAKATGGSTSHNHGFSGTTAGSPDDDTIASGTGSSFSFSRNTHSHAFNGTTDASGHEPPFYTVVYCKKL